MLQKLPSGNDLNLIPLNVVEFDLTADTCLPLPSTGTFMLLQLYEDAYYIVQ